MKLVKYKLATFPCRQLDFPFTNAFLHILHLNGHQNQRLSVCVFPLLFYGSLHLFFIGSFYPIAEANRQTTNTAGATFMRQSMNQSPVESHWRSQTSNPLNKMQDSKQLSLSLLRNTKLFCFCFLSWLCCYHISTSTAHLRLSFGISCLLATVFNSMQ